MKKTVKLLGIAVLFTLVLTGCEGHNDLIHTHQYGEWKANEVQHWKECACGDITEITSHTGDPCDVCGYTSGGTSIAVSSVSLNINAITLAIDGTETLIATINPDNASNKNISWSSNNTAVATVDSGIVSAVASGTATITVTTEDGGKTAACEVSVPYEFILTVSLGSFPQDENIILSEASSISRLGDGSLTITDNTDNVTARQWIVDGIPGNGETGASLTLRARDFAAGTHTVSAKVTVDGKDYSKTVTFTVVE